MVEESSISRTGVCKKASNRVTNAIYHQKASSLYRGVCVCVFANGAVCVLCFLCCVGYYSHFFLLNIMKCSSPASFEEKIK
jgi:hypothetical protein